MNQVREWIGRIKGVRREHAIPAMAMLLCGVGVVLFLRFYFAPFGQPYMMEEVVDLSQGWVYETQETGPVGLDTLRRGPDLRAGETITLRRTLNEEITQAALLVHTNHQTLNLYLDDVPLHLDEAVGPLENPGMALHLITLPQDYSGKTLRMELTSPYAVYSGRTRPVMLGTIPSLEAWALSSSMRATILMAMCLLLGLSVIVLTFIQALYGTVRWQNLALGVFAVNWALYYICTELIVYQFFSPVMVSTLSLGLYYCFQVPLSLYFYFSFCHYKRWMLPAVVVHLGFVLTAVLLRLFGVVELPALLQVNNLLLAGLLYTVLLAALEAAKGNRMMALSAPFLAVAYLSMLYNFYVFYTRRGVMLYTYRDTYLLLILIVLICNIWQVSSKYFLERREAELFALQSRLARESYESLSAHLMEVGGLKHEIKNHLAAMNAYLTSGRYDEARDYLAEYTAQADPVTEAVYHENFLINAVLWQAFTAAQAQGVEMKLDLRASPAHIADPDLYTLLSNILENALEACAAMPEDSARFITLTLSRREPYFAVTCVNSKAGERLQKKGELQTTKQGSGHGYGLWTIERIAQRYSGLVDFWVEEQTFTLTAALKDRL